MKVSKQVLFVLVIMLLGGCWQLMAQGKLYEGPEDEAGDIAAEREGYMTGNRVFLYFRNTTELSDWPRAEVSRWPNNYEGLKMTDGIGLLVAAKVYVDQSSVPETNPALIKSRTDLSTLYFLQTSYREEMDTDPTGTIEWGLYPCWGYFNETSEYPAMSNKLESWPTAGWPSFGRTVKWPGEWDGRFGRGVIYADLETYFVNNDAQDQEYLGIEDKVKYYPRPGRKIGDVMPHKVTIQKGLPWGGLGIRVEQRGFQWNNPQARDAIFWEYTIANISDYDVTEVAFGYWVDNAIGQDSDDELGYFDRKLDLAYSWDKDGVGLGGQRTGTMGFAYLESPGLAYDGVDNDDDGLIDEKRDNGQVGDPSMRVIGPSEGITDMQKFLETYKMTMTDLRAHWNTDEDQDWEDGEDLNGDGVYQISEYAGDDVGLDGVGPSELNYAGPDEGECNHRPDFKEGVGCEPNYAETDVTESDMIGLTSFMMFPVPSHSSEDHWFRGDKSMWEVTSSDTLIEYLGKISNLIETFASGSFPLYAGRTERISMSELHSYDPLTGLSSTAHSAPALYELKKIVQIIYEKDYRFAQPPKMPTLAATAGDGRVILTWDDIADTRTRDPFVGNVNDFEGYKVIRSTDKKFADAEVITDGYGTPMFKKPIYQCDLKDKIFGFADFGLVNGMGYNLGTDSGISHHFIDETVQNGRTYYYAVVAYDYGAPLIGPGISPSENNTVLELDEAEQVIGYSKNIQIVIPRQKAAGYIPPSLNVDKSGLTLGTGTVTPEILSEGALKKGHTYTVKFLADTLTKVANTPSGYTYTTTGLAVYDQTLDHTQVYREDKTHFAYDNLVYSDSLKQWYFKQYEALSTDIFDGMRLLISGVPIAPALDLAHSGWVKGSAPMNVILAKEGISFPWVYDIVFTDQTNAYSSRTTTTIIRDELGNRIDRSQLLTKGSFSFYVLNKSILDNTGSYMKMDIVAQDLNKDQKFDPLYDRIIVGALSSAGWWAGTVLVLDLRNVATADGLPKANDVYRVNFTRPFAATDSLTFTIQYTDQVDVADLSNTMKKIKVVPNPYVATNAMEPSVSNYLFNQRRRLMFTHIPARCDIKIFTMSGMLVDEVPVNNATDDGIAHWDLTTREGLEIAAGVYIYHVKATDTNDEFIGKFAVIK